MSEDLKLRNAYSFRQNFCALCFATHAKVLRSQLHEVTGLLEESNEQLDGVREASQVRSSELFWGIDLVGRIARLAYKVYRFHLVDIIFALLSFVTENFEDTRGRGRQTAGEQA